MTEYQIAVIIGSLRRDSLNRRFATAIARLAPSDFSFKAVEIGDLPRSEKKSTRVFDNRY